MRGKYFLIRTAHRVSRWPGVRQLLDADARHEFIANRDQNMFYGVYYTWEQASRAAEAYGTSGYDNAESAELYLARTRIMPYDYPPLYWMTRFLMEGQRSILDLGGSIGIKYYAFKKHLEPWPEVSWTVHDVPAAVDRGRRFAKERGEEGPLRFVDEFDQGEGADVLFASGVLQYLPRTLAEMLSGWKKLPPRIVINITPVHEEREFFTVNSIGTAFCPYRVQTQSGLMSGLTRLGYKLRALWQNEGKTLKIPFRPELYLAAYSGYCLDLVDTLKHVVTVL